MNDYLVLTYVRDEMLSDPYIDANLAWSIFKLAEHNGDAESLMNRWMIATPEEKIFVERLMVELLEIK